MYVNIRDLTIPRRDDLGRLPEVNLLNQPYVHYRLCSLSFKLSRIRFLPPLLKSKLRMSLPLWMAYVKLKLLTSPSFPKIRTLSILFQAARRDPRKFPASTAVAVVAFPSSYIKVPIENRDRTVWTGNQLRPKQIKSGWAQLLLPVFTWRHKNSNYKTIDPPDILFQWGIRVAEI